MNKKEYTYSIIIPHRNTPDLLQRLLNSIPDEDHIQTIIVDDNSDASLVNFDDFPGKNRTNTHIVFSKEKGRGAGYARNLGMTFAKGEWLLFADSDDEYIPNFVSIIEKKLSEDLQILYFNICEGGESINGRAKRYITRYTQLYGSEKRELIRFSFWEPWNKVFSRDFVFKNSLQFEERPSGNDMMFCLQASALATNYLITNEHLYILHDQPNSITYKKKSFDAILTRLELSFKKDQFLQQYGLEELRAPIMSPRIFARILKNYGLKRALKYYSSYVELKKKWKKTN